MVENNHRTGLGTLGRRLGKTALGVLENRGELLSVEWQQEKARLTQLLLLSIGLMFGAILGTILLTATVIFLFPQGAWVFVAAGFTLLYLGGAGFALFTLRSLLKKEPFSETLRQLKKDRELLDAFE